MPGRLAGLPPAGRGIADWYETQKPQLRHCPNCNAEDEDVPQVLEYLPALDPSGYEREKHPGWERTGWLVWWRCEHCGADTFTAVPAEQVAQWGRILGGWRRA